MSGHKHQKILPVLSGWILLCIATSSFAQRSLSITFKSAADSTPIKGIVVQLFEDSRHEQIKNILLTDKTGKVKITCGKADSLFLLTSHLNYAPLQMAIAHSDKDQTVYLQEQSYRIKEVTVSAIDRGVRVKGDTIRFDLKVFRNASQKDLKDLLKTLPGVEVTSKGRIKYGGRKIDKILISGRDVARSQFEALNRLIAPPDLSTVQIVPGEKDPDSGQKAQYLDLVLAKENKLFLTIGVGVAHNLRTEEDATLLQTGERKIHHFASIARRRLDRPALTGADALRGRDFEVNRLRNKYLSSHHPITIEEAAYQPMGPDGKDLSLQYNATMQSSQLVTLYLKGYDRSYYHQRSSRLLDVTNGGVIESSRTKGRDLHRGISGYIKWKVALHQRLKLFHYFDMDFSKGRNREQGKSLFEDIPSQYFQTKSQKNYSFSGLQEVIYNLTPDWKVTGFWEFKHHSAGLPFHATSNQSIFEWAPASNDSTSFGYGVNRRNDRLTAAGSLLYESPTISYGLKNITTVLQLEENGALQAGLAPLPPFESGLGSGYIEHRPGIFLRTKNNKFRLKTDVGVLVARQRSNGHLQVNSSPFIKGYFDYFIAKKIKLTASLRMGEKPFDLRYLWRGPTVQSVRYYQINETPDNIYSFNRSAGLFLDYKRLAQSKMILTGLDYSESDRTMVGIQTIHRGYQVTTFRALDGSQSWKSNTYVLWPLGRHSITFTGLFTMTNGRLSTPAGLSRYRSIRVNPAIVFRPKTGHNLTISAGLRLQHTRQKIALLHSDHTFTRWIPNLNTGYKLSTNWKANARYEGRIQAPFPTQNILSFGIEYSLMHDHLTLSLNVHDLLHFNRSDDYTTSIETYAITEQSSLRLGGYVLLHAKYRL